MEPSDLIDDIEDIKNPPTYHRLVRIVDALLECEVTSVDTYRSTPNVAKNDDKFRVVLNFSIKKNRGLLSLFRRLQKK